MELSHDTQHALATVVDLINTGPQVSGDDRLGDLAALQAFVAKHDVSEVGELTGADLAAVVTLRERFHAVFLAESRRAAAEQVNAVVADARTTPRLTDHDGYDWHVHYFAPGATLAEHLSADCGMSLAHVIASGERERLRVCEAPDCQRVLLDLSRNRSRRYCDSRTCGNRLHVAAYRERRRAAAG